MKFYLVKIQQGSVKTFAVLSALLPEGQSDPPVEQLAGRSGCHESNIVGVETHGSPMKAAASGRSWVSGGG